MYQNGSTNIVSEIASAAAPAGSVDFDFYLVAVRIADKGG